jgi:phytol kinase
LYELLLSALPSPRTLLTVAPLAAVYTAVIATIVGKLRLARQVRTAYTRKIFHFSIFTMASVVQLIWHLPGVVVLGSVVTLFVLHAAWRGDGFPLYEALARPADAPHRTVFIIVPLLTTIIGGVVTNSLFPHVAFIGYLVCGWGDAVGEPIGSRWGRHRYRVPSLSGVPATRSMQGSAAVFVVGSIAAMLGFYAYGATTAHLIVAGVACGLAGAIVEALSNHGLDNLTTQFAAAAVAALMFPK